MRVGIGTDVHPIEPGRPCWVAGLLLGRTSTGAPATPTVTSPRTPCATRCSRPPGSATSARSSAPAARSGRARAASALLAEVRRLLADAGWTLGNAAVQVIGNAPRIGTRRAEAEQVLVGAAGGPVSVSGTTTDGLGLTGRGEGLAAIATALLLPRQPRLLQRVVDDRGCPGKGVSAVRSLEDVTLRLFDTATRSSGTSSRCGPGLRRSTSVAPPCRACRTSGTSGPA